MDPISDMLIRIKNAQKAGQDTVFVPYSRYRNDLAQALRQSGMVGEIERKGKKARRSLHIHLLYSEGGMPKISSIRLISKPSRRLYTSYKILRRAPRGGITLLTTSRGIMTSAEARKEKVGGQLIAHIW